MRRWPILKRLRNVITVAQDCIRMVRELRAWQHELQEREAQERAPSKSAAIVG
jgi:hypothetical protein